MYGLVLACLAVRTFPISSRQLKLALDRPSFLSRTTQSEFNASYLPSLVRTAILKGDRSGLAGLCRIVAHWALVGPTAHSGSRFIREHPGPAIRLYEETADDLAEITKQFMVRVFINKIMSGPTHRAPVLFLPMFFRPTPPSASARSVL